MPIRRHASLVALSREHHGALQLARALRIGVSRNLAETLPREPAARVAHVRAFFARELAPHFAAEEQVLLAAVEGRDPELDALCRAIRDEHVQLRAMLEGLEGERDERAVDARLDRFGTLLEEHVRKEERALYPAIETALGEAGLAALSRQLEAHHAP